MKRNTPDQDLTLDSAHRSDDDLEYDIFLSFEGLDTRKKFTDHLYMALKDEGFRTFRDDDILPRGKNIKSELSKAIMNSKISVVILSENYRNSKACMFEIQTILERYKKSDHLILPVFYEVDPNNIKEQANDLSFGKEVAEATVKGWSAALKDVASLAGMISRDWRYEAQFIKEIVVRLKRMLAGKDPRNGNHLKREENGRALAGRSLQPLPNDFVENTEARNTERIWECLFNDEVTKIGVYGMGGIGKTTIMKHIYNQLLEEKSEFDTVYWITVSKLFNIKRLQRDLAKALNISLSDGEDEMRRASEVYTKLSQRVSRGERYVLILDDLWEAFPLDRVGILEPTRSNGCKLVVTTRSLQVCRRMDCYAVKVELLTEQESLTLFLCKAVEPDVVLAPEVKIIATKMARKCARLPLAIVTVAGSMRGLKEPRDWRNALARLINSTKDIGDDDSQVFECLKLSYTRLGDKVLQDCFLCCAWYPEDRDIPMKELIEYWIAEGLITDHDSVQAKFDKGQAILRKLTDASLLERLTHKSGEVCVRIPDLIRDMALRIAKEGDREVFKRLKYFSYTRLGDKKHEENGRVLAGRLLQPLPNDFVENTKARNTERVWECLFNDEVTKIGVYGMGGVGKTTIMKHIYNQLLEEKNEFHTVCWITVSTLFNIKRLQRDLAKALNISLSDGEDEMRRASELYTKLSQRVSRGKRYVLILDDLWEAFHLDRVGILEPTRSNGCKLVVTTRSLQLCKRMDCYAVKVELLTERESLTLFLCKAVEPDVVLAPEVKIIATKMARKCACLPLAIVTVAGSMRGLKEPHDWRNALNEWINSTKDAGDVDSKVFKQLKFSYTRLGDKVLQDCFLYCALYPEGHGILVKDLIEYWIAEGLIADLDSVQAKFGKGQAILRKLTNASLLERFTNQRREVCVRLHDLIRDMALRITKASPRFMVKSGELVESITYEDWSEDLEKISLTYNFIKELPKDPPQCPRLTTLLFGVNELSLIPNSFFTYMHCLKVLDLSANKIESLPNSISDLVNLEALILADSEQLEDVPSLKEMKALKVFKLTNSLIKNLPEGIEELVNLRKLDLSSNKRLKFANRKLHRLSKLQSLIIDGTRVEVSAEALLCLSQLKVVSVHLRNVAELTCYVTSQEFQRLEKYSLMVGRDMWPLSNGNEVLINIESKPSLSGVDQVVLPNNINFLVLQGFHVPVSLSAIPGLKDARHLHRCEVRGCDGLQSIFSSSFVSEESQISLRTVKSFYLSNLPSCRLLFDGILPQSNISFNLKRLTFESCHRVKNIFLVELLQNFPNLEQLKVDRCENVEDIIVAGEEKMNDSNTIALPRLQYLFLNFLPKLKSIYTGKMVCESVQRIHVTKCSMLSRLPLSLHMDNEKATAPPALKCITGEEEWWGSLVWDPPHAKSILEPFLERGSRNDNDTDSYMDSDSDAEEKTYGTCSYSNMDIDTSTKS